MTTAGQTAYEAYAGSTGWKSAISGAPLPTWDAQADAVKTAWEAAGDAVMMYQIDHAPEMISDVQRRLV